ncbi:MAG: hypothetical protein HRT65_04590 [Flavobacteriaceae bacterium]|nr:hypothetical protein [Flavobacteriaceae bacterium]
MNDRTKIRIAYLLLAVAMVFGIFYLAKTRSLRKELVTQEAQTLVLQTNLERHQALLATDSLLATGHYNQALKAYNSVVPDAGSTDSLGIRWRLAIAQRIQGLQTQLYDSTLARTNELDTLDQMAVATPEEIDRFDSLQFAHEKTKAQLARIRKQLQLVSAGEYLTFQSSKGSPMHYVGQVKNHKANGHGVALLSTGSRYEGEWKNNQRHGQGKFFWADGQIYDGSYVNDKREGQGTYLWPNGEKYVGLWKNDERSGEGVFYGKDGKIMASGTWEDDQLVAADKKQRRR